MNNKLFAFIASASTVLGGMACCYLCNNQRNETLDSNIEALTEVESYGDRTWRVTIITNTDTGEVSVDCQEGGEYPCPKND